MNKIFFFGVLLALFSACYQGQSVDLIVHNAKIYTLDGNNHEYEAMAIRDGKIVEVGPDRQIQNKYAADEIIDAGGRDMYPGFTDAHGHLLGLAQQKLNADLVDSKSMNEIIVRLEKYASRTGKKFIVGRGWDQSLWSETALPDNQELNKVFPTIPVALFRVDGHAVLVNDCLLKQLKITLATKVEGGIIHLKDGKCSGLLVDNAMNAVFENLPKYPDSEMKQAILEIQEELFQYGITGVHEAGINFKDIAFFKKMVRDKELKINLYAMLYPTPENIQFAKKNGKTEYRNMTIRSFKVMGDGALGSRGACLKKPYSDEPGHFGVLTTSFEEMKKIADICELTGYQMNVHAIGDSTNKLVLDLMERVYEIKKDHRWRIEHAQVLDPIDIFRLGNCGAFPSVQPTHATTDQRWAKDRLGEKRMQGAYAYQSLLNQTGIMCIGTDFPVESINPFLTIHAAVNRKNKENFPSAGFQKKEAISFLDCIKGMTLWSAFAAFQENKLGTLEKGKDATFAIFENKVKADEVFRENFAFMTFIKGKKVYSAE
jgi:predicted amidohydrolase YtcJ